ncbi:MAG: DUF3422 domain-containing protein [Proteobacteria bacterium]|nr:DUF3422 domain-containing protein [Pseudomonadota bacterium]
MISLPENHVLRRTLNDEAHARPPEALVAPMRLSFLALEDGGIERAAHEAPVRELCSAAGLLPPPVGANHFSCDLDGFRLTWEKHTEFTRYMFVVPAASSEPFESRAIDAVPSKWLASLPGKLIAASHVEFRPPPREPLDIDAIAQRWFAGNTLIGATLADGKATAFTDFRIHGDGFSRFLIFDGSMAPRQAGRTVQRLLEIDAYRILAMLALPVARETGPHISQAEGQLVAITDELATGRINDEPQLLDRLTRLEAQVQQRLFRSAPRFSASEAYYRLIQRRTDELREGRVEGVQTFREFIERRLSPAMSTCTATSARLEKLFNRVSETTQLLSTRVEVSRQRQAQNVLESLDRRADLQLRLQETVEGLSVAAITYYIVGLIAYIIKGVAKFDLPFHPDALVALTVPFVAALVALAVRRIRNHVAPPPPERSKD